MLALMRKCLAVKGFHHDFKLFLEQLAVGVAVDHRSAEGLHLARVVAAPDPENHPAFGEDVHHRKVLGQPDGVPHGQDVEPAAELDAFGVLGQVLAHNQQVGDALVPLALKVVLGHPQDVKTQIVQEHRCLTRNVHRRGQPVIVIPSIIGRNTVESDAIAFQHMAGVKCRKCLDHWKFLPGRILRRTALTIT